MRYKQKDAGERLKSARGGPCAAFARKRIAARTSARTYDTSAPSLMPRNEKMRSSTHSLRSAEAGESIGEAGATRAAWASARRRPAMARRLAAASILWVQLYMKQVSQRPSAAARASHGHSHHHGFRLLALWPGLPFSTPVRPPGPRQRTQESGAGPEPRLRRSPRAMHASRAVRPSPCFSAPPSAHPSSPAMPALDC